MTTGDHAATATARNTKVLAGDRNGVSFYAYDRICDALELTPDEYLVVRKSLIDKDLIAFDGRRFQVLSLPPAPIRPARRPLVTQDDFEDHTPPPSSTSSGRLSIVAADATSRVAPRPRSIQTIQADPSPGSRRTGYTRSGIQIRIDVA